MTPFSFRLVAAWLNISTDNGPVLKSVKVICDGFVVSIWSFETGIGGRTSSSGGVCDSWGTAIDVRAFLLLREGVSSDNMGSKEFSVGIFSFKGRNQFYQIPHCRGSERSFPLIPYENNPYGYNTHASKY